MLNIFRRFVPKSLVNLYHFLFAFFGAVMFTFPARKLFIIGVTGTNGKSTTVDMISRILKEAGYKVASISSVRFQIDDKEWRNTLKLTMPGRFFIQRFLRQAVNKGCTHAVIEVTSEGILQHRHRFINFHTAVFTNLSPEHIERHGSYEKYREAKGKLFQITKKVHVINADDKERDYFLQFPAQRKLLYGIQEQKTAPNTQYIKATNVISHENLSFQIQDTRFFLKLFGEFNVYNALAAICVGLSQGISLEVCKRALERMQGVPGRMELVVMEPFKVFVDYAFTPAALEKVYKTVLNFKSPNSKLICVLGAAGGGRDRWKRPVLGSIAANYCDRVIITNEDPYDEDPLAIIEEVAQGTKGKGEKIFDRREAIAKAISFAETGDIVIITGKGSEDSIAIEGGKKIPWDDRIVVREEMDKIKKK